MKAVVFDFGYTLVNEDRAWREHAEGDEVTFFAALGAVIERREHHRRVFDYLRREQPREPLRFEPRDFYPDAIPCLRALKRQGRVVGVAGNTGREVEDFLSGQVDVDFVGSSARWGVEKPDAGFFARVAEAAGCSASEVMYVGDRIDNDVVPAAAAGMTAVFVLRGPWAHVQQDWPEAQGAAHVTVTDLASILPL